MNPTPTTPTDAESLAKRLESPLPVCPFDRRSPDYYTAGEGGAPCTVCGTTEDGPDKCRGADTRCMAEAAAKLRTQEAELIQLRDDEAVNRQYQIIAADTQARALSAETAPKEAFEKIDNSDLSKPTGLSGSLTPNDGWQDIATAPKDGTTILLWSADSRWPDAGNWVEYEDEESREDAGVPGFWQYAENLLSDTGEYIESPTHWRPLPAAPDQGTTIQPSADNADPINDPKYAFREGRVWNREDGKPIPDDEPVFVFRARDCHALNALDAYLEVVQSNDHAEAVEKRIGDFERFATEHPDRMKEPDTAALSSQADRIGEGS